MCHDQDSDKSPKAVRRQQRKQEKEKRQLRRNPKPIEARTPTQQEYIDSLHDNELTFAVGPAGVGKTYVPARVFGQMISAGEIDKLYLSRPPVAKSKHRMGFLPGTEEEKTAPWIAPIYEGLKDSMAGGEFDRLRREKKIEIVPYEFMQGRTFRDAAWIVDEAENLDLDDFYITLTRQGEDLRAAICGDIKQSRINNSGLKTVVDMAAGPQMEGIGIIEFGEEDVVRSRQARQWVKAFNRMPLPDVTNCDKDMGEFQSDLPAFLRRGA
jgi:phosphate starvation-inducible PhoH-like protein